jgi:hypothetical protein
MLWPFLLTNARLRAQPKRLERDCAAAITLWLTRIADTAGRDDAGVARWVLTENGAGLRERWTRRLEEVVGEAVGPVWSGMDAAEDADLAAADGDGVVLEAFERFAFRAEELVDAVLDSPAVSPTYAHQGRQSIAELAEKVAEDADADELCLPGELSIMPLWEWLGGYLAPPMAEPPGPRWERVAPVHQPDGTRAPDLWIHRPTEPAKYLMVFAASLWDSEWKAEARHARGKPPALVFPVYSNIGLAIRHLSTTRIDPDARQLTIPGLRPAFEAGTTALRDAMKAAAKASPVVAHRLIRSVVQWGTLAALHGEGSEVCVFSDGEHELCARKTAGGVDIVCRSGGLDFLTKAIGHTSKRDRVGDILDIFAGYGADWNTPNGRGKGALLHWKGVPGSRGYVVVSLTDLLLPGVAGRKDDPLDAVDNRLIPTLPLPSMDGLSTRSIPHLCSLDWLAIEVFTDRRAELLERGSVWMDWGSLAASAGFSRRSLTPPKAVAKWVSDGDSHPSPMARWVRVEGAPGSLRGRFTLVSDGAEGAALDFIREGALRVEHGREKGRASNARRKRR